MAVTRVIRYRTRPECAEENARLIRAVFDELDDGAVPGIRYTALLLDDGVSFLHVAVLEGEPNPLDGSPAFAAFQAGLRERLEEGPVPATASRRTRLRSFSRSPAPSASSNCGEAASRTSRLISPEWRRARRRSSSSKGRARPTRRSAA